MERGLRLSLRHTGSDDRYLRRRATKSRTDRSLQPLRYSHSRGVLSSVPGANARLADIPKAVPHIDVRAGRACTTESTRAADPVSPDRRPGAHSRRAIFE